MGKTVNIDGVDLILNNPDEIEKMQWIGGETYMTQLLAAWIMVDEKNDIPMNPQILGKPGVGKTTLAYTAAKSINLPVFIFQCTVDTRPEDLLVSPVIGQNNTIKYHASALVSAMIEGGVCILDEANRMSEKSWASLAPLLDQRRYIESIIAGIKIKAHPAFRICVTMNDDSSTFEVPEYIHSRLQPQIFIDFPDRNEEFQILQFNLPYAKKDIILYTVNFLQRAHQHDKEYSVRDGINICRYYLKCEQYLENTKDEASDGQKSAEPKPDSPDLDLTLFRQSIRQILGSDSFNILSNSSTYQEKVQMNTQFKSMFDKLNDVFIDSSLQPDDSDDDSADEGQLEDKFLDDDYDDDDFYIDTDHHKGIDESDDDVIHLIDKNEEKSNDDPFARSDQPNGDNSTFNESYERIEPETDPNDMIREFLERKERQKQSSKANKKKKKTRSTE